MDTRAVLSLETGEHFFGYAHGGTRDVVGEVVFNTSMTGYQEISTDPSYRGQIVVLAYPLINNYGANRLDPESRRPWLAGLVVRELAEHASNWRNQLPLDDFLAEFAIPVLSGIDTRRLVRILRSGGVRKGLLSLIDGRLPICDRFSWITGRAEFPAGFLAELTGRAAAAPSLSAQRLVEEVTYGREYEFAAGDWTPWPIPAKRESRPRIALLDTGAKSNIARSLTARGCRVSVLPYGSGVEDVNELAPDGIVLANGPGDPEAAVKAVDTVRSLIGSYPLMGICLGHQIVSLAIGARTSRLKFGPPWIQSSGQGAGQRQSVHNLQNHGFQVEADSIPADSGFEVSHLNLNDSSVEGLAHRRLPVFTVPVPPRGSTRSAGQPAPVRPLPGPGRSGMRDPDLNKVLIIGSGPIVIGQAAEFDYAGTQACKAVREEGITTVLINSNPATIMTDEDVADVVYIEPLTVDVVERIIQRERPDGLLATLGGQTGLNLAREVQEAGILERYGVRLLGTPISAIRQAEDRDLFRRLMLRIEEPIPGSDIAHTVEEARVTAAKLGFPLIVRPAYTLGGTGGGIADHPDQLDGLVRQGIDASPIGQVLVEEYLAGWKEVEYEVMRDAAGTCVTICNMENFDPMGVHTGDSIVFAPSQTLSDKEYQLLRSASLKIIDTLDIAGGCKRSTGP